MTTRARRPPRSKLPVLKALTYAELQALRCDRASGQSLSELDQDRLLHTAEGLMDALLMKTGRMEMAELVAAGREREEPQAES